MKDYCKQILGKSIREITIEDLKSYFLEKKEETEILEFKSGQGDFEKIFNKNILRTVSAFLNSSGGLLIWGSPEDKVPEKGLPKVCIGDLVPVTERKEKDQLINRISSSISYMPTGILVERIDVTKGFIYIIEVQESSSKPHQLNGQYFIRLDGQSKPAPHYIVDSMFNQIKQVNVECHLKALSANVIANSTIITFSLKLFNFNSSLPGKEIHMFVNTSTGFFKENREKLIEIKPTKFLFYALEPSAEFTLEVNNNEIQYLDYNSKLNIFLAGENIPTKISEYEILYKERLEDIGKGLVIINSNVEASKIEDLIVNNREDSIKNFLKYN